MVNKKSDFVLLFVKNQNELAKLVQTAIRTVEYDGLLWIAYPKKSAKTESDLSRDILWDLMDDTGLQPVHMISIDQIWSAMRFRPKELVNK